MNRCFSARFRATRRTTTLALGLLAFGLAPAALAQNQPRTFPDNALRGTLVVVQPPVIQLDGKTAQLSPGARIRGTNNMLLMSGGTGEPATAGERTPWNPTAWCTTSGS